MYSIRICHLYPDTLNLYGDTGNIVCMKKRLEARGIEVETEDVPVGKKIRFSDYDIFFIGGGQDFDLKILFDDLNSGKGNEIKSAIDDDRVFLCICGGYQLLGQYYKTWDGNQYDLLGALNLYTVGDKKRMIGNYAYRLDQNDGGHEVIGFENHSGRTYLGEGVKPLGEVLCGYGNNGEDKSEGARYKNVFATYSHGPALPKNPGFCDLILKTALLRKYGEAELAVIDDTLENAAHESMALSLGLRG